ncbi:MAG: GNAT family N-acetyltransferase [Parcubacteria group bacterium]|nr:GNAT family N-acetyltransferase [Parcubacteria group bacterium]
MPSAHDIADLNVLRKTLSSTVKDEWTDNDFKSFLWEQRIIFVVAVVEEARKIVGMGSLHPRRLMTHGTHGLVEDVAVIEAHQEQGIGKKICECLIAEARSLSLAYLELSSNDRRGAAHRLYLRLGFKKVGTRIRADGTSSIFRLDLR